MDWASVITLLRARYKRTLTQGECDYLGSAVATNLKKYREYALKTCGEETGCRRR